MSGIEVASLVIGVLPILVEAVKSYTTIYRGFQTFRHYSKEVKTFSVQLKTQKGIFCNEIRLLLRLVEDAKIVDEMIGDAGDCRWGSKQLNDRLSEILQHDFESYKDTIEETVEIVEHLKLEVEKYNVLLADKSQTNAGIAAPADTAVYTVFSLFDMMRNDADEIMETDDQLKLAHKTALAMLQYNDTPWLSERWRLGDLNYFGSKGTFDETAFKSLHLSSQISAPQKQAPIAVNMEGIQGPANAISEEMQYGINNVTLFFLGVALLEIAYWKPIEDQMKPSDRNNQIFAARRIASSRPSSLGPAYQKIAEKCLQCNFGFGTKLESKRLQTAVYNDVVCGLEKLLIEC
ncbi:hypothetical protein N0V95_009427 [Ascochyta clinopodiicola]|nr:hypothetical protein N0V95_009427 [Ascochyta clinopodiicola]